MTNMNQTQDDKTIQLFNYSTRKKDSETALHTGSLKIFKILKADCELRAKPCQLQNIILLQLTSVDPLNASNQARVQNDKNFGSLCKVQDDIACLFTVYHSRLTKAASWIIGGSQVKHSAFKLLSQFCRSFDLFTRMC